MDRSHETRSPRIGRMPRWQRWTTYALVGSALGSGLGYLVAMDVVETSPDALSRWWIAHGATGLASLFAIGGAATGHVVATWRARAGRIAGATNLALLIVLAATAVALFYGPQRLHAGASTAHWVVGLAALAIFPIHIVLGRRRDAAAR